ncbi:hypothetical protein BJ166DRAFT_285094 [Pestalotiopsis sp. NC0098]|nr:hypothetical protein BJ166DRAFT_285094 [Pestalotiopsis sp. NC0098]
MRRSEEAHAAEAHDDPPPPYYQAGDESAPPPLPTRPATGDVKNNPFLSTDVPSASSRSSRSPSPSSSSAARPKMPTPVRPTGGFPADLNMYYQKAVGNPTFNLGETEDRPHLSVTFHSSLTFSGNPYFLLHATADPDSPPLAVAEKAGRLGQRAEIALPPVKGPDSGPDAGDVERAEMKAHASLTSVSYTFSVETAPGVREKFEWRASKGNEVKALVGGDRHHASGRKLVRLATEADGVGGTRAVRDQGASSDGREVVAVWADNPKWSGNKAGALRFLGSGASGVLGGRFAVMTIATSVRIWEMMNESSLQSAATGSLGAGNE